MIRLHVVGCPRSGTTLMAEMLASCFANVGHDEHELSIFRDPPASHPLYVSKKPADVKRMAPLLRADPDLFVVNVHRDPRAVITSIIYPGEPYRVGYEAWARCVRAVRELEGHPRFLDVRYERLVREPEAVQAELETRFPFLVRQHPLAEFDRHARPTREALSALGGVRAVDTGRVERWREHLPRVKGELRRHPEMIGTLIELGYETDASWTCLLDDVEAYEQPRSAAYRRFFADLDEEVRYRFKQWLYIRRLGGGRAPATRGAGILS